MKINLTQSLFFQSLSAILLSVLTEFTQLFSYVS